MTVTEQPTATASAVAVVLSVRMELAMESAWTDREGVMRVDHTCVRMRTLRALQRRGLVQDYSHVLTDAGRQWFTSHTNASEGVR